MEIIPPDLIFSNWIVAWFVLYMLGIVAIAPKLWMMVGLFGNFWLLLLVVFKLKANLSIVVRFVVIVFITKALPLFVVRQQRITQEEVVYSIVFLCVHLVWLFLHWKKFAHIASYLYKTKHQQRYVTIFSYWYDIVLTFFKSKHPKN